MNTRERKEMFKKTFDLVAPGYDNRATRFFTESLTHLVPHLNLKGDENILDVATGTGNAALELACKRHGSLPRKDVVAPAVQLARPGTTPTEPPVKWRAIAGKAVSHSHQESRESFFPDGDNPLQQGDFFKAPHLDTSLELIAK